MKITSIVTMSLATLITIIILGMWGCPQYRVWQQQKTGEAELKRAEQNRQIKIQEAIAEYESAKYKKQADSIRAVGTAMANSIISGSLTPQFIQWKWVEGLNDGHSEVIYVPTEANLPLLESVRMLNKNSNK
jgi:regulator of protease activity HflC (stomatin/prohibitin superfamily)